MYTTDQYTALKEAIALGALTVEYSDKKITYRSLSDMKEILADMADDLGMNNKRKKVFASVSKGLDCGTKGENRER